MPDDWGSGDIVTIFKRDSKKKCEAYRESDINEPDCIR